MTKQLVFIHGRAQQQRDAVALKSEWVAAWKRGLGKSGLSLPIDERDIRFPYYGQTLYDIVSSVREDRVADVIVRGSPSAEEMKVEEQLFINSILEEVCEKARISLQQIEAAAERDVIERGALNATWIQAILAAVDSYVPGASGISIALATRDVYQYLRNPGIKNRIDTGVRAAIATGVETVVVSHSLGSVVAYDLLRRDGDVLKWQVPLFVTLGSPLAVTAIKRMLRPIAFPTCAARWYNAMDDADVVALYPLDAERFDVSPAIENKVDVKNHTLNRHGIDGYLDDADVARRIYDALQ